VSYTSDIADILPETWNLAQLHLNSSYKMWGFSSLQQDVEEISKCVNYFRTIKSGKIILMGHSTGCQDVMEYITGKGHENRAVIDGAIMQAPVSDRSAMMMDIKPEVYRKSCITAQQMVERGDGDEILPFKITNRYFTVPVTAKRWLSLASPNHDGDDDYFSADLTDEQLMKTFGKLPANVPMCILLSEQDEYVPVGVDANALWRRWLKVAKSTNACIDETSSGYINGASHTVSSPDAVGYLITGVLMFLKFLEKPSPPIKLE
jgi:hypothetical protein